MSAISGTGTGDLMEQLVGMLPPPKSAEEVDASDKALAVAIIGRPNVGKSSILNSLVSNVRTARCNSVASICRREGLCPGRQRLCALPSLKAVMLCRERQRQMDMGSLQVGEERSIVSAMSGTTRDAIDTELTLPGGQRFTLIDTAGIRKRTAVASSDDGAEPLSVNRALQAVRWTLLQACLGCTGILMLRRSLCCPCIVFESQQETCRWHSRQRLRLRGRCLSAC